VFHAATLTHCVIEEEAFQHVFVGSAKRPHQHYADVYVLKVATVEQLIVQQVQDHSVAM
jgi:hypothetical protein